MKKRRKFSLMLLFLAVLLLLSLSSAWAQAGSRLEITAVDASEFPIIRLRLIAADGESGRIQNLDGLILAEDGTLVEEYETSEMSVGTEVIFVIDANATIDDRDEAGGVTRREKVRESIIRYSAEFMDQSQLDRVSIVVPGDDGSPELLLDRAIFPNAIINEINFYETNRANPSPSNEMLQLALEHAVASKEEGRFQAIVLFSDAAELGQQLDYPALIEAAQAINIPIFSAILGGRADQNEKDNVARLAEPTRGGFVHMPDPADTDPIYAQIQEHKPQFEITYESRIATSGPHELELNLDGAQAVSQVEVTVEPPVPEIIVDNSLPIRRVVPAPDSPLNEAEPATQPIVAQIVWPDGHPRAIVEATLSVNGIAQPPISEPEMSGEGLITLDWDISNLDDGTYQLVVSVVDQLGLQGQGDALPLIVEVDGRAPANAPVVDSDSESSVPEDVTEDSTDLTQNIGIAGFAIGLIALIVAVAVLIVVVVLLRRRKSTPAAPAPPVPTAAADHEATQVIRPAFATKPVANAYLEALENAPEHRGTIPIATSNVTIGRDPNLAQIVFTDKSVSRLHARITEENGVFQIYDEGSASGTYINFEQVGLRPQVLKDNDEVHIGQVHLRFRATVEADDSDSTQVMPSPMRPQATPQPAPEQDDFSTQPYMPNQPPPAGQQPPRADEPLSDGNEDDVSTQPYMPHSPKR
jgi:pSer/pThr/pTyr-binding forkhead associated (FHA) protein